MVLLDTGTPVNSREIDSDDADSKTRTCNTSVILHHYIFIISHMWLNNNPRKTVVQLNTGTLGTSGKIYSEHVDVQTRTHNRVL